MFKKKKCKKCGKEISNKYDFCPHCGNPTGNSQDWGMLGKNDLMNFGNDFRLPVGMNKLFNTLVKSLGKELNKELSSLNQNKKRLQKKPINKSGISIRISTIGNNPPEIKIDSFGDNKAKQKNKIKEMPQKNLSTKNLKKLSGLPKEEPLSNVKRFSDKVVYEIDVPGVESIDDISIVKLENSIEIKALTKDKVYAKLLPVNLPITNYNLSKGKLVLELGEGD